MIPVYICVQPDHCAFFEGPKIAIQIATKWCLDVANQQHGKEVPIFVKTCGTFIGAPGENLRRELNKWICRKSFPRKVSIPFITESGHKLDVIEESLVDPDGWILTNKHMTTSRKPVGLPPDFLFECLCDGSIPDGCPIEDLEKSVPNIRQQNNIIIGK